MANDPPSDPRENDAWVDDEGELFFFDGTNWVPYMELPDDEQPPSLFR